MTQQLFIRNIKGLFPLVDRRKIQDPFVVEGQNFLMDQDGPFSGLGRSLLSHKSISRFGNVQTFKISETSESLIVNDEGVFRFDTESGKTILLYPFETFVISEFPWSIAAVGNKYYLARKNAPFIEYDIFNDSWQILSGGSIPENIHACTESDGRLHVLTDIWLAWSAIGDGQDFVASTTTGAGAQALTKLGLSNPRPLGLKTVPDGVLTFLSSGIMKSQSIVSVNPYRHIILSRQHVPVNPYCLTNDESDAVIFLTKTGFYRSDGQKPTSWEPAMGEHFHTKIIPNLDVQNNQNNLQIDFNVERSWFSVWIAETQADYTYSKAFILNTKIAQWGSLNTSFTALTDFFTLPTQFEGFFFGLIDLEGSIFRFDTPAGIQTVPDLVDGYSYHYFWEETPTRVNDTIYIFTSNAQFSTEKKSLLNHTGVYYRYHQVQSFLSPEDLTAEEKSAEDSSTATEFKTNTTFSAAIVDLNQRIQDAQFDPLDSYVNIGPIRLFNEQDNDRYSYITNVSVGTLGESVGSFSEDWNSVTQFPVTVEEDWLDGSPNEDWGDGGISSVSGSVDYDFEIVATIDAETPIANYETKAIKINTDSTTDFYSCDSSGIYHLISINAFKLGQNFHAKTLDIAVNLGGRI